MNSGIVTVHHNDPDNFVEDPENFAGVVADSSVKKGKLHPNKSHPG